MPMELEAEPLPEPPVPVPSLEPTVPPPEEKVSCWRRGKDFQGSACRGAISPLSGLTEVENVLLQSETIRGH